MKRYIVLALIALVASGCSSVVQKNFKVFVDPPDADIRVVSGMELKEIKFRSPANVAAEVPKEPALAAKAVLEVRRDNYKPVTMQLGAINDGQTLNLKLEKIVQNVVRYKLSYRLVSPEVSDALQFRDSSIAVSFTVGDQSFQMRFENRSAADIKILWERAEYTDVNSQPHRLMHSGIRFPDRNNPLPDQVVPSGAALQEAVTPVDKVFFVQQKKSYDIQLLFPIDNDIAAGLKGKVINIFLPVEVNHAIIPYNFKIEITSSVKEAVKG